MILLFLLQISILQPAKADSLWKAVVECSGRTVQPGGDLSNVKWFEDTLVVKDSFPSVWAVWHRPDSIVLDVNHRENWVIAHELLHHLLRGPPLPVDRPATELDTHPLNPFWFPCKLMAVQNL